MAANYFTDEQVKELVNKAGGSSLVPLYHPDYTTLTHGEIKALMNLAVEEAIGDVVAYEYHIPTEIDGWSSVELSRNELDVPKDTIITNLYSVKELEELT